MWKTYLSTFLVLSILFFCSCASRKRIAYFTNIDSIAKVDTLVNLKPMRVQTGDFLQITISTTNRDISALYNPMANFQNINSPVQGYLVDQQGYIDLPQIGKVFVRDKSIDEINSAVKAEMDKSVKNAFVATRILNFKVSVLGDVAKPGSFNVFNERITILEALSLAGDANFSAKRDEVLLIREREGKKSYVTLNLNDSKVLSSPYYYLTNNDVVYVRPGLNKFISSSAVVQLVPVVATSLSLLLVLYTSLIK